MVMVGPQLLEPRSPVSSVTPPELAGHRLEEQQPRRCRRRTGPPSSGGLGRGHALGQQHAERHRRVDVAAGDRADGVGEGQQHEPEGERDARPRRLVWLPPTARADSDEAPAGRCRRTRRRRSGRDGQTRAASTMTPQPPPAATWSAAAMRVAVQGPKGPRPTRGSAAVGQPVEDLLDDGSGMPGESAGSRRGTGPGRRPARSRRRGPPRPAPAPAGAAGRSAGPRTRKIALRARVASRHAAPASAACSASSRPAAGAPPARRRSRSRAAPGAPPACCSWSSCTVHSTSASPPRPSLVCVAGSAPRGSRSRSTRALIRRISATCSAGQPVGRVAHRVDQREELRAQLASPATGRPAAAPAPPRPTTSARSTRGRPPGCAPAGPAGPPGAGRRRPRAPGRARARRAAGAARAPRRWRAARPPPRRRPARARDEQHVGVGAVAHLAAAEPAHRRSPPGPIGTLAPLGLELRRAGRRPAGRRVATATSVSAVPDADDVEPAEQVGAGDPQQLAAGAAPRSTPHAVGSGRRRAAAACRHAPASDSAAARLQLGRRRPAAAAPPASRASRSAT